ncbi:unnamed protein product [Didymodactylos carnosus]|uniref:Uncharacterized protein n=1 Tax=Didymodactylos carnosus TaxID=1234261 RepID=A0A814X9H8_9BILA|nr:unnamed protein product [Didymodactylos carnosus]CAF3972429.1 unnamed protein product [Didymodactylos carnosus]
MSRKLDSIKLYSDGIAANELPRKHYDETINSSRAYRLDHDTNGIVSLRVIIQPPKPREDKKKQKTEPRDLILLDRRETISLLVQKALVYRLANNNSTISINQLHKELKKIILLVVKQKMQLFYLRFSDSPNSKLFTVEPQQPTTAATPQPTRATPRSPTLPPNKEAERIISTKLLRSIPKVCPRAAPKEAIKLIIMVFNNDSIKVSHDLSNDIGRLLSLDITGTWKSKSRQDSWFTVDDESVFSSRHGQDMARM